MELRSLALLGPLGVEAPSVDARPSSGRRRRVVRRVARKKKLAAMGEARVYVAFYFPDRATAYDTAFASSFLGNFYPSRLQLDGLVFQTAEAAFQAKKLWRVPEALRRLQAAGTGTEAYRVAQAFRRDADLTYGFGAASPPSGDPSYDAMLQVLWAKFAEPHLTRRLLGTGDAFLLEHNEVVGRDDKWSDNGDGTGRNLLGEALMATRERLRGQEGRPRPSSAPDWAARVRRYAAELQERFGPPSRPQCSPQRTTGLGGPLCVEGSACFCATKLSGGSWRAAAAWPGACALQQKLLPLAREVGAGVAPCAAGAACTKAVDGAGPRPSYNGAAGEFCSRGCRAANARP